MKKVFLCLIFLVTVYALFFQRSGNNTPPYLVMNNRLIVLFPRYAMSCSEEGIVNRQVDGTWTKVPSLLQGKADHYILNGNVQDRASCETNVCHKVDDIDKIDLAEYEYLGDEEPPQGGKKIPSFRSKPLKGPLMVSIPYYTDTQCRDGQSLSLVFGN
jgi:hypothetical protein